VLFGMSGVFSMLVKKESALRRIFGLAPDLNPHATAMRTESVAKRTLWF
jgi:hypothetical protein